MMLVGLKKSSKVKLEFSSAKSAVQRAMPVKITDCLAQICENVSMYAIKYGEEFHPHLASFVAAVWQLLTSTGLQVGSTYPTPNRNIFLV